MLEIRLADGLRLPHIGPAAGEIANEMASRGLVSLADDRVRLTVRGRLLADHIATTLLG
jgi:hypothetical protein